MFREFKKFVLRGNVVDLAVAVVIGAAFTAVVTAFVKDFLGQLIALITQSVPGKHDFAKYEFHINGVAFPYGDFLNTLLTFILTAAVVFFLVVQPLNHLNELARRSQKTQDPTTRKCPECVSEIPAKAKRCMYCTSRIEPLAGKAD